MSVEARALMMNEWTRWQGHVVNGVYPLGRILGCSEHSGVFLTRSDSPGQREVAIKLFPASLSQVELQLPRWAKAGALSHPHLLPLLESGACQLDGLTYLYVVMEYADQTLAQLLPQRALSPDEARDLLTPTLDALAYLLAAAISVSRASHSALVFAWMALRPLPAHVLSKAFPGGSCVRGQLRYPEA